MNDKDIFVTVDCNGQYAVYSIGLHVFLAKDIQLNHVGNLPDQYFPVGWASLIMNWLDVGMDILTYNSQHSNDFIDWTERSTKQIAERMMEIYQRRMPMPVGSSVWAYNPNSNFMLSATVAQVNGSTLRIKDDGSDDERTVHLADVCHIQR